MAEAIEHSLQHLSDDDLNAIAVYVKDVAPVSSGDKTPRDKFGKPSVTEYAARSSGKNPMKVAFEFSVAFVRTAIR